MSNSQLPEYVLDRLEQICIEDMYSKTQVREFVLQDMESGLDKPIEEATEALWAYFDKTYSYESKNTRLNWYINNHGIDFKRLVDEVLVIILPMKTNITIQSVAGKLASYLNYPDPWDGVRTAAEIVAVIGTTKLYDILPAKHSDSESGSLEIRSNYCLEPSTLERLSQLQYLPPLLCKPNKISRNFQSVYLTKDESMILGNSQHHNLPLALDAINIANSVELSLDLEILKLEETSKKPLDTPQKIESFTLMKNQTKKIAKDLVDSGNKFHLGWRYDSRSRMYSSGYHINIQASEYKKAMINLANKQVIKLE